MPRVQWPAFMFNSGQSMTTTLKGWLNRRMASGLALWGVLQTCAMSSAVAGEPSKLTAALDAADDSIRLELQGTSGITYSIEASDDLEAWALVGSGPAANGLFVWHQAVTRARSSRYYRGREGIRNGGGNPFPISVVPVADTNLSVTTLITTNGGSALLYARDGTRFKFIVPAMTLPSAEIVTMTLVTNVGGLPFAQGIVGAVRLEPDRLALWGAGTLEIELPPGLDRRKIASFAATSDGNAFHLTLDRVTTNAVIIPVARLGLFGSALASITELRGSTGSPSRVVVRAPRTRASLQNVTACFPDRAADASSYNDYLDSLLEQESQSLAQALTAARQEQLSGESGDTFDFSAAVERAEGIACGLIRDAIQPLIEEAKGNCALSRVLLSHSFGIERQRQLLGIPENSRCLSGPGAFPLCDMMENCVKEIRECCGMGIRGQNQIAAIFGLWRQEQLLGLSCLSEAEIEEAVDICTPGVWSGTLILKTTGEKSDADPVRSRSELQKVTEEFEGQVTDSVEFEFGQATSASLRVEGHLTSSYESDLILVTENADGCSGFFGNYYKTEVAKGPAVFSVTISTGPGRAPLVTVSPIPDPPLLGQRSGHEFERSAALVFRGNEKVCDVRTSADANHQSIQIPVSAAIFGQPSMVESNRYSGVANLNSFQLRLPGKGAFSWNFTRQKASE